MKKVYRTELTPVSFLDRSVLVFPEKVAVIYGDRKYTYREFGERVNRLASHLRATGMQKHDRVAFLSPNTPALLEAHFAVPAAGGTLVAINTRLNSQEIGFILKHSGSKYLFVDAELEHLVTSVDLEGFIQVRIYDTGQPEDPYERFLTDGSPQRPLSWLEEEEEDIAIYYTSGTRGENISTIEVEQAIAQHPAVMECAIVAVPDEQWGERPKAFVTLKHGQSTTEAEIITFCRERVAHFKCPVAIEFGELPKTSTGKVQKYVLREKEWKGREKRIN